MKAQRIRFTGQVDVPLVGDDPELATPVAFEGAQAAFKAAIENLGGVNTQFEVTHAENLDLPGSADQAS